MFRRVGAGLAVLALLSGLSAAPFTHAHDDHHADGGTLVHSHTTSHEHEIVEESGRHVDESEHRAGAIRAVDTFVGQPLAVVHAPIPGVLITAAIHADLDSVWLGTHRTEPVAHGPPAAFPPSLRAPPLIQPTLS